MCITRHPGFAQDVPKRKTWAKNLEDLMPRRRVINHFMRTSYIWLAKIPW